MNGLRLSKGNSPPPCAVGRAIWIPEPSCDLARRVGLRPLVSPQSRAVMQHPPTIAAEIRR